MILVGAISGTTGLVRRGGQPNQPPHPMRKALLIAAAAVMWITLAGCALQPLSQQQRQGDTLWRDTAIAGGSG
jgi:hypothetical protein